MTWKDSSLRVCDAHPGGKTDLPLLLATAVLLWCDDSLPRETSRLASFFSNAKSDVCFAFVLVIVSSPAGYHSHRLTNAMPCLNKVTLCSFSWHNILHHRDEQARYRTIQSRCEKKTAPAVSDHTLPICIFILRSIAEKLSLRCSKDFTAAH